MSCLSMFWARYLARHPHESASAACGYTMSESQFAVLLTLGASLSWSFFDTCRKVLAPRVDPIPLTAIFAWFQVPIFLGWALWSSSLEIASGYLFPGFMVLVFNLIACLCFFEALRRSPLSVTVPILSFVPAFAGVGGWLLLGEELSLSQWGGVILVGGGTLFLNARRDELWNVWKLIQSLGRESGSLLMVVVAFCWSTTSVFDKIAMQYASAEAHAGVQVLALGAVLTVWLAAKGKVAELGGVRNHLPVFISGGFLSIAALSLQLHAVQVLYVGLMEAIKRACGIVFAIVLGRLLFKEEITLGKIIACVLMIAGIYLLG